MALKSVILLSGGLDSYTAFHWALKESQVVLALTVDYGQRAAAKEIESASKLCAKHGVKHQVIELPWFQFLGHSALTDKTQVMPELKNDDLDDLSKAGKTANAVWVPNRNGILINVAAGFAESLEADWVVVGFNREEAATFPDNSDDFVQATNNTLKYSTREKVKVQSPMSSKNKKEIVAWGLSQKIDYSHLWSCYLAESRMCGQCESCSRLKRALKEAQATQWLEKLF